MLISWPAYIQQIVYCLIYIVGHPGITDALSIHESFQLVLPTPLFQIEFTDIHGSWLLLIIS